MKNIFQSKYWEEFKLQNGYEKSYWTDNILILQKNLPFGRSLLYSPLVDQNQLKEINKENFQKKIKEIGLANNSIFYRLELDIPKSDKSPLSKKFFAKAFEEMQPEDTLVIDLTKDLSEILAEMKQKGRYNLKIAQKNQINISSTSQKGAELDEFYSLYSKTAKRHNISRRNKKYFDDLIEILGQNSYSSIYTANIKIDDQNFTLASAIIVYTGDKAIYMFGSSSDEYKNLMAPYLLHWQIINDAKNQGFKQYDFFGIAPDDDPKHPWAGVTRFKKQFGGTELSIFGSYDLILKPLEYQLFKIAEKIRRR